METNSLFPLRYRIRKTDELVEIVAWETAEKGARSENDWVSYIDSAGVEHIKEHLTLEWDFVIDSPFEKIISGGFGNSLPAFDPWEARRYELTKEFILRYDVEPGLAVVRADNIIAALKKSPEATERIERYYTRKECCEILRCSLPTFHALVNKGLIPVTKVGRKTFVPADEFGRIVESGELRKFKHHPKKGL